MYTERQPWKDSSRSRRWRFPWKPNLSGPWSWTSNLQNCEMINFCCLSHPAVVLFYDSPRKIYRLSYILILYLFMPHCKLIILIYISSIFGGNLADRVQPKICCYLVISCIWLFATPRIAAHPAALSFTIGVYSNSCPLSLWCYLTISSSVAPFPSCPQSFIASRSFPTIPYLNYIRSCPNRLY